MLAGLGAGIGTGLGAGSGAGGSSALGLLGGPWGLALMGGSAALQGILGAQQQKEEEEERKKQRELEQRGLNIRAREGIHGPNVKPFSRWIWEHHEVIIRFRGMF